MKNKEGLSKNMSGSDKNIIQKFGIFVCTGQIIND